jgi:hypothetical protein
MKLEVHRHSFLGTSSYRNGWLREIVHSHVGGDEPHQHEGFGPATYTIDKDSWYQATGLKGGGRKQFTVTPSGPQVERVELEDWQRSFKIVVVGKPPVGFNGMEVR